MQQHVEVHDGYIKYQFTNIEDANQKFLDILRAKLRIFLKNNSDIDYFDVGSWMFYDNYYIIPSNLLIYLQKYKCDIFNHIDKYNLQDTIMGIRIEGKAYKEKPQAIDRKNDSRANTQDAE